MYLFSLKMAAIRPLVTDAALNRDANRDHYISQSEQWSANQRNPSCGILASVEVVMGIICEFI